MPIIIGGASVNAGMEVESNTRAARITSRPMDVLDQGAFAAGADNSSAVVPAGALTDQEIWQLRWTDPAHVCVVRSIFLSAGTVIAFVAGKMKFDLFFATAWTAAGTGGGTLTLTGRNAKKRTGFATTSMGEIRTATTAALTAGTKTLDAQPLVTASAAAPTVIGPLFGVQSQVPLFKRDLDHEPPIVLTQNEGLVIRTTVPGTGTWYFGVQIEWAEANANSYLL